MKKILVADDRPASLELVMTALESTGYTVREARNGRETMQLAQEWQPDLILLDLHMPVLDGFGALAELRNDALFTHTPIVALTASGMAGDCERVLAAGFTDYISKPISVTELRAAVVRLLAGVLPECLPPGSSHPSGPQCENKK